MPSVARSWGDENDYWRGRSWAPMGLLVYLALGEVNMTCHIRILPILHHEE